MNPDRLLAQFDRLAEAPDAIPRLRRFILDLAVRGKLVEQDPNDEPAAELLKRIAAKKKRFGIKHAVSSIKRDEIPFDLPLGWAWIRLGEMCLKTGSGSTPRGGKEVYKSEGVLFLRSQNIYDDDLRLNDAAYIDSETHNKMLGTKVLPGDLLLNITGGSIGRCCRVPDEFCEANVSQHVAIVRTALKGAEDFLHRLILSPYFQSFIFNEQTGAGRGGLPKNRMDRIPVALPPLTEQHRIVAKVDELMALCDQLETARAEREQGRERLLSASLQRLNQPTEESETFRQHARFVLDHLPRLTVRPEQIKSLRQMILNLAVRGRLVPQNPDDEPAAELLKRIAKDRFDATQAGRFKVIRGIADKVSSDNWEIPENWVIAPLPAVIYFQEGPGLRNWQFRPYGIPFLNIRTLQNGRINRDLCQFIDPAEVQEKYQHFLVREGDILCSTSGTIGKLAVAVASDLPLMLNTSIVRLCPYGANGPATGFIKIFLGTNAFLDQASKHVTGSAQVNMGPSHLKLMAFPLPPLAEQHRIVAKVNELMAICDQLEAHLSTTQTDNRRLLEAVLHEALADAA